MPRFLPALLIAAWLLPAAAQEGFDTRAEVRDFSNEMQALHGFEAERLLALFHQAHALPAVIKAIQPPADPGIRSWQAYRGRFVEPRRIAAGVHFWQNNHAALKRAEQRYGVPAEIIAAIIGVETIYGRHTGRFECFSALTTLAFDYPPRAALFRRELEALLLLARDEGRDPLTYRGSYAAAMGLPQFLPSSVRSWAVDFDGNGDIDLTTSADAIGSVANFLAEHGWEKGGPVLVRASASGDRLNELLADDIVPKRTPHEMEAFGVEADQAPEQAAALIELVTPGMPAEYRLGFHNFYVLTRYNQSSFYATAVYDLAMELKSRVESGESRVKATRRKRA